MIPFAAAGRPTFALRPPTAALCCLVWCCAAASPAAQPPSTILPAAEPAPPAAAPAAETPAEPIRLWKGSRPNVLFLVSDDQHPAAAGALGNREVVTPTLDGLVGGGLSMERAFCMGSTVPAVCQPSRAMFLSGRSLYRVALDLKNQTTLPEWFRKAGWRTHGVGKWHNGQESAARSFESTGRMMFGGMSDPFAMPVSKLDGGKFVKQTTTPSHATNIIAEDAMKFLRDLPRDDQPFFLYAAFTAPHDPRVAPPSASKLYDEKKLKLPRNFLAQHPFDNGETLVRDEKLAPWPRTEAEIRRQTAEYYATITHLDSEIGRILSSLDATGRRQDTLVVFLSDHGLALGRHGLLGKQNLYDHSMGAPLLISGPHVRKGGSRAQVYLYDVFPTVCELAGISAPPGIEGKSFAAAARGEPFEGRKAILLGYRDVQRAVRTNDWKLVRYPQVNVEQLFNLTDDPDEQENLADDPAAAPQKTALLAELEKLRKEFGDPLPETWSENPKPSTFVPPTGSAKP